MTTDRISLTKAEARRIVVLLGQAQHTNDFVSALCGNCGPKDVSYERAAEALRRKLEGGKE